MLFPIPEWDEAVTSAARQPDSAVYMFEPGNTNPTTWTNLTPWVSALQVNRGISSVSDQVSLTSGTASAEASFTLFGASASSGISDALSPDSPVLTSADLSPYRATSKSLRNLASYGIGQMIVVQSSFWTVSDSATIFRGVVDQISVNADGSLDFTCLDMASMLKSQVVLPALALQDPAAQFPAVHVVEHLLRTGNMLCTPAARDSAILSVPSMIPEVGQMAAPLTGSAQTAGHFHSYVGNASTNRYTMTSPLVTGEGAIVTFDGWFRTGSGPADRTIVTIAESALAYGMIRLGTSASGQFVVTNQAEFVSFPAYAPNDSAWHYFGLAIKIGDTGVGSLTLRVDGTSYTVSQAFGPMAPNDSQIVSVGGFVHEGVQVCQPTSFDDSTFWLNCWTGPNFNKSVIGSPSMVRGIPRDAEGTAWELIQQLATGVGAVCRFTESGDWLWKERSAWTADRLASPVMTLDGTRAISDLGFSYSAASRRRNVTVAYTGYTAAMSTAAAPAYVSTDRIDCPPSKTIRVEIETENALFGISPPRNYPVSTDVRNSWFQVCRTSFIGDPANAVALTNVRVSLTPSAKGFVVTIRNPNIFTVSLWDQTLNSNQGGPALTVHGYTMKATEATASAVGTTATMEDLNVDGNPWRHVEEDAQSLAWSLAAEVAVPTMEFESIKIVSDVRIQLEDIVGIQASSIMDSVIPCQIVAMTYDEGESEMTLSVRPCQPPTGWILGLSGRSELGSTSLLVA